jgi:hypothetical protein
MIKQFKSLIVNEEIRFNFMVGIDPNKEGIPHSNSYKSQRLVKSLVPCQGFTNSHGS